MIARKDINTFRQGQRILLRANEFICLLPHAGLREYVSNYNITFPTKVIMSDRFTEMPSGCATLTIECDGRRISTKLNGPTTAPCLVGAHANHLNMMVTVEFRPAGLYALTGIDQWELIDASLDFQAVDQALTKLLSQAVETAQDVEMLVSSIDLLLLENIQAVYHPQLRCAFEGIAGSAGSISIKSLSDETHYSERHLNRVFKQHVGIGAKSFSRLIRVNRAFQLLKKPHHNITWVSDVMGFHDVSHFIRDFRSVCGITPQAFRSNVSDFYINPVKL